jgi:serine/threonine protein phosphatase PrpC
MKQATESRPRGQLPIGVGAVSEIGQREENQDCMTGFSSPFGAAYVVADGMGGYQGGADASRMVIDGFTRHFLSAPPTSPLRDAITLAVGLTNLEIIEKARSGDPAYAGMGSTIVVAVVRKSAEGLELTTANVGDSRVYLQRGNELTQLTRDQTRAQWLVDNGIIDAEAARTHPEASVLTRAMGHVTNLEVDVSNPIPLAPGDGILLCSDGLSGFATDADILHTILLSSDPADCANRLARLATASNSNDNITVQFLRVGNFAAAGEGRKLRRMLPADGEEAAPSRRGGFLSIAILSLILVGCAAGGFFLWKYWDQITGSTANDPVAALIAQVDKERERSMQITNQAMDGSQTDESTLRELTGRPHPPEALINEIQADRHKFDSVTDQVNLVGGDLDKIANRLDTISTEPDQKKTLDELTARANKDSATLTTAENELTRLEAGQAQLRREAESGQKQEPQPPAPNPSPVSPPATGGSAGPVSPGAPAADDKGAGPAPGTQPAPASDSPAPAQPVPASPGTAPKPTNDQPKQPQLKTPTVAQMDAGAPYQLRYPHRTDPLKGIVL